jgi:hypothetical protein
MCRTTLAAAAVAALFAVAGCQNNSTKPTAATAAHEDPTADAPAMKPIAQADAAVGKPTVTYARYGEPVKMGQGEPVTVKELLADVSKFENKPVRVLGTVDKVCERKGCWLQMADGDKKLFVKFTCPVDGRLIPMDAVGKKAVAQGQLKVKEITEDDARHLAEEGGQTPDQVAKIKGPQKQITLASPGAIVYGVQ